MKLPGNITHLAEKNLALVQKIGFNPLEDEPYELDSSDIFSATGLFTDEAIRLIFDDMPASDLHQPFKITEEPNAIQDPSIGMVLVRPDMLHASTQIEKFIAKRFKVLESVETTVGPEEYWRLYCDAVKNRETTLSRLTRAAVYIGSPVRLIVFSEVIENSAPVADIVYRDLKGAQGLYKKNTLRGEVVYNCAIETGFHDLLDEEVAMAADPFGAYRKIVDSNNHGLSLTYPLLFFTGVGVHIPSYSEVKRDLGVFDKHYPGVRP